MFWVNRVSYCTIVRILAMLYGKTDRYRIFKKAGRPSVRASRDGWECIQSVLFRGLSRWNERVAHSKGVDLGQRPRFDTGVTIIGRSPAFSRDCIGSARDELGFGIRLRFHPCQ
jgi:hypothetical protein